MMMVMMVMTIMMMMTMMMVSGLTDWLTDWPVCNWPVQCRHVREVALQTSSCQYVASDAERRLAGTKALYVNVNINIIIIIIIIILTLL